MIPSLTNLSMQLRKQHENGKKDLRQTLLKVPHMLMSDGWTRNANVSYTMYTAQYVDSNWKFQSCVLETSSFPGSHTAERIKQHALNTSENFGITGTAAAFVHDEAANMEAASRAVSEHHRWASVTCAAHRL